MASKDFTNGMKHFHAKLEPLASAGLNYDAKLCPDKVTVILTDVLFHLHL